MPTLTYLTFAKYWFLCCESTHSERTALFEGKIFPSTGEDETSLFYIISLKGVVIRIQNLLMCAKRISKRENMQGQARDLTWWTHSSQLSKKLNYGWGDNGFVQAMCVMVKSQEEKLNTGRKNRWRKRAPYKRQRSEVR